VPPIEQQPLQKGTIPDLEDASRKMEEVGAVERLHPRPVVEVAAGSSRTGVSCGPALRIHCPSCPPQKVYPKACRYGQLKATKWDYSKLK